MFKIKLAVFVIMMVFSLLTISACNTPGSSGIDQKYVGKYYGKCFNSVSTRDCILELGPSGQISDINYAGMVERKGTCKVDGNKLLIDWTGDGTTDESDPINGNKITHKGESAAYDVVYIKMTDQELAAAKAEEQKKAAEKKRQEDQKQADEQKKARINSEVSSLKYYQEVVETAKQGYQDTANRLAECQRQYPGSLRCSEAIPVEDSVRSITGATNTYNQQVVQSKLDETTLRQNGLPVSYNPDGTPNP